LLKDIRKKIKTTKLDTNLNTYHCLVLTFYALYCYAIEFWR